MRKMGNKYDEDDEFEEKDTFDLDIITHVN